MAAKSYSSLTLVNLLYIYKQTSVLYLRIPVTMQTDICETFLGRTNRPRGTLV